MKYIKKFEYIKYIGEFWILNTDEPIFEISLTKIGVNRKRIDEFLNSEMYKCYKKICGSLTYNCVDDKIYGLNYFNFDWMPGDIYGKEYYESNDFKYMGEVIVTGDEIEQYEIKKNANKYNL